MRKIFFFILLFWVHTKQSNAANYYWRATAVNNLFTNVGNWETAPGGGVSPSTAPGASDDVFFPVTSTQSNISFNAGSCRDFNFSAPTAFVFTGTLNALAGNVSSNGNATFGVLGAAINATTISFTAASAKTLNMGTSNLCIFGTLNFTGSTAGSYTLGGPLNTYGYFTVSGPSFSTGGKEFTYADFTTSGTTAKTINFSNSRVTHIRNASTGATGQTNLGSSGATTTYTFTNAKLYEQNDYASLSGDVEMLLLASNLNLNLDSLVFNASSSGLNKHVISFSGASATPNTLTMNVLRFNTGNVTIGTSASQGSQAIPYTKYSVLNAAKVVFDRSTTIYNYSITTLNIGANGLVEPGTCSKLAFMNIVGTFNFNATPAITTTSTDYYGITFGGGGVTAATTSNLAFNTGTVTWGAAATGTTYYWVQVTGSGTGNWNDPSHWSLTSGGAGQPCLPTLLDNVVFDANSFSGSQTVTIPFGYDAMCKNIDWSTGGNKGLLVVGGSGGAYTNNLIINGDANFSGSRGINAPLLFLGSGSQTLTSGTFAAYKSYYIRFQGTGTYTLQDNLTGNTSFTVNIMHRAGTLNANGKTITGGSFSSTSTPLVAINTRNLNLSNSTVNIYQGNLNAEGGFTFLDISYLTSANFTSSTINYNTSTAPQFIINKAANSTAGTFLTTTNFNVVNFNASGTATLNYTNSGGGSVTGINVNITTLSMTGCSANISNNGSLTHNVGTYALGAGNTYAFQANRTFNITSSTGITLAGGGSCSSPAFINSLTTGTQATLNKTAPAITLSSAVVQDIKATGAIPLTVTSGINNGGNTNVTIAAVATGRIMYWVGGTGNWSDGNHWSINTSGASYPTSLSTNPNVCTPTIVDSVVFDGNSFSAANQTVTIDQNVQFTGMLWTAAAGAFTPKLAGSNSFTFSDYGCLEFAQNMTVTYNGTLKMKGGRTTVGGNTMKFNGVTIPIGMDLAGIGLYELLDNFKTTAGQSNFSLNSAGIATGGSFNAHGNQITVNLSQTYVVSSGQTLDLTNATLISNAAGPYGSYNFTFQAGSTFISTGSNIYGTEGFSNTNNTGATVSFNNLYMTGANSPAGTNKVTSTPTTNASTFKKIAFTNTTVSGNVGTLDGNIIVDTLSFAPKVSYTLTPSGGRNYVVNDTLIAYGNPCAPGSISSTTPGTQANLSIARCNLDLSFVSMQDINFTTCTAAQNKVIGADNGNNTNVTLTSLAALTKLGNDTTIYCKYLPYNQPTTGFGTVPGTTYLWGGGQTTNTIPISTTNTYSVTVTYAPGCFLTDSRTVTTSMTPPKALASGKVQKSTTFCTKDGYMSYEGNGVTNTADTSILSINPNGNIITPDSVVVNNQGNLTPNTAYGTFSNTGTGYYQITDGTNSLRLSKRLHTIVAPGSYTTNGGVIVRVYYEPADTIAMLSDAWPAAGITALKGWIKHKDHYAQNVIDSMKPLNLVSEAITPIAYGTEGGVNYAEFKLTGFSTIGYLTSTVATALPLHWLSFSVSKQPNSSALLHWKTAAEFNNHHFDIEHQMSGEPTWNTIGRVEADNALIDVKDYSFLHQNLVKGVHYYRIKQVDKDGQFSYSEIRKIEISTLGSTGFRIIPNPIRQGLLTIEYNAVITGKASLQIINAVGQVVRQYNLLQNRQTFEIGYLSKGVYAIRIQDGAKVQVAKCVVDMN